MRICSNCGASNEDSPICRKCGALLPVGTRKKRIRIPTENKEEEKEKIIPQKTQEKAKPEKKKLDLQAIPTEVELQTIPTEKK